MKKKTNLKFYRDKYGMTPFEFATKIGISVSLYYKLESEVKTPSYRVIVLFKKAFPELSIEEVFLLDGTVNQ
ncbi:helix-turn-helix transcriptional regulator [bacterium AH-315-E09]|nr:helix-turn-helix transcriptional regulator [Alkaliphilus sp. AH-315-G20]MBN4074650.1 helix-turn-helix transcriptional regulator [bacterium AH-315-E09]